MVNKMKTNFCYRTESYDYRPEWMRQGLPVPTPEQIQVASETYKNRVLKRADPKEFLWE
jgi:hypothetical protein